MVWAADGVRTPVRRLLSAARGDGPAGRAGLRCFRGWGFLVCGADWVSADSHIRAPRQGLLRTTAVWVLLFAAVGRHALAQPAPQACILRLDSAISQAWTEAVERKLNAARQQGVRTFILELNTPGGTVQDSMDLADFIFQIEDMDVIAYVHPAAYSGGTLVALACKQIYIDSSVGMMGDVAPVSPTGEIVGEKVQTVLREKMASYARARGYPEALVKAMVTKEMEVHQVQFKDEPEGHYSYLTGAQYDSMSDEERAKIAGERLVVPAGELLTMDAQRAVQYGFARKAVASPEELFDVLGLDSGAVKRLYLTSSERVLTVLDMFSPLLIIGGFVLLFIELTHPGLWAPGVLGVACFVVFFVIKWTLHYARMLEVVLFLVGLVLLLLEILVIPGFGVAGVTGIALLFISLVLAFQEFNIPRTATEVLAFEYNLLKVTAAFGVAGIALLVLARYLPFLPVLSRIVHRQSLAAAHAGELTQTRVPGLSAMAGRLGVAATPLRPAGRAEFGDQVLDVVTQGDFVEKGARVRIVEVRGGTVVVQPQREA